MSFEVDALVATVIAFGLDDLRRVSAHNEVSRDGSWITAGVVSALVTVALVVSQFPQWPYASQSASILPANLWKTIPAGNPVAITYPYTGVYISAPMDWQTESGFKFRLQAGYALHPGTDDRVTAWPYLISPPDLQQFLAGETPPSVYGPPLPIDSHLVSATRETLTNYDIRLVIVQRSAANSGPVIDLFTRAIGAPQRSTPDFVIWASGKGAL